MRKPIPLPQLIEDIEAEGLDPSSVAIDRDDLIELPEEPAED